MSKARKKTGRNGRGPRSRLPEAGEGQQPEVSQNDLKQAMEQLKQQKIEACSVELNQVLERHGCTLVPEFQFSQQTGMRGVVRIDLKD